MSWVSRLSPLGLGLTVQVLMLVCAFQPVCLGIFSTLMKSSVNSRAHVHLQWKDVLDTQVKVLDQITTEMTPSRIEYMFQ